jgi:hypothetical protein
MQQTKYKEGWLPAKGLIYSIEWIEPSRNDFGHYNVVYSYRVNDEMHTGHFRDYTSPVDDYLHRDDTIDIQYNPKHEEQSHYPLAQSAINGRLTFFSIGAILGAVVMLIVYLSGGFR